MIEGYHTSHFENNLKSKITISKLLSNMILSIKELFIKNKKEDKDKGRSKSEEAEKDTMEWIENNIYYDKYMELKNE